MENIFGQDGVPDEVMPKAPPPVAGKAAAAKAIDAKGKGVRAAAKAAAAGKGAKAPAKAPAAKAPKGHGKPAAAKAAKGKGKQVIMHSYYITVAATALPCTSNIS